MDLRVVKDMLVLMGILKNKAMFHTNQYRVTNRKDYFFPDLLGVIIQLFRGTIASDQRNIFPARGNIASDQRNILPDQRKIVSDHGNIASDQRNILPDQRKIASDQRNIPSFQRIIHLFRGIFHSRCGIKLSCCGSFLCLSEIKPTLFELFSSNPNNRFGFKIIKTLIYG